MKTITQSLVHLTLSFWLALIATSFAGAGEKITYIHNDALGSPVAATNQQGQVIWRETYRPHGQRTTNAAASANNKVWFTGKQEESALGINYFGARWYHPEVGRFLVIDPVGVSPDNIHSFNRYGYANNNPYGFVDPDGRDSQEAEWAALGQSPPSAQMVRAAANVAQAGKTVADVGDAVMPNNVVEAALPFALGKLLKFGKAADNAADGAKPLLGQNPTAAGSRTNTDLPGDLSTAKSIFRNQSRGQEVTQSTMSNGGIRRTAADGSQIRMNPDGTSRVDLPGRGSSRNGETIHIPPRKKN